ncbi:MAG: ornithine cyclodeaminase family protein [Boseongicola sp.]|nr:ornithine cyclodeaminase family protein [Boseongicola sp.]
MHLGPDHLYLPDSALEALEISPAEIADAIEAALIAKAEGRLQTTPKSAILPGDGRYMMSTLAVGGDGYTVLKTVGVYPGNADRGLPATTGAILVLDAETGVLKALLGAAWVTAVRTAALSAVAARKMADPASETIAFIGCGVQASSHLAAFHSMFPIKKVLAVGRGRANVDRLVAEARGLGLDAEASEAEAAVRAADIVVSSITLNYDVEPFLDAHWLRPGAFAAITDLFIPWKDETAAAFGNIYVDDLEQERSSPKPMVPAEVIAGDLTDLATGSGYERRVDAPSAFVFRGLALGDYAASVLALERAESLGVGQQISPEA